MQQRGTGCLLDRSDLAIDTYAANIFKGASFFMFFPSPSWGLRQVWWSKIFFKKVLKWITSRSMWRKKNKCCKRLSWLFCLIDIFDIHGNSFSHPNFIILVSDSLPFSGLCWSKTFDLSRCYWTTRNCRQYGFNKHFTITCCSLPIHQAPFALIRLWQYSRLALWCLGK